MSNCVLCGSQTCKSYDNDPNWLTVNCNQGYRFRVHKDLFKCEVLIQERVMNLIYEKLLNSLTPSANLPHFDYYPLGTDAINEHGYYNMFIYMKTYPHDIIGRINRSLVNLASKSKNYGQALFVDYLDCRSVFASQENYLNEAKGVFALLCESGYLTKVENDTYTLSVSGWKTAESLKLRSTSQRQAFIAISFGEKANEIKESLKSAISSCGFNPVLINEKEHNNQIVPEIFHEISKSSFVVVDTTIPNNGAYYEAGYAQGLGKQVIVCCKRSVFEGNEGEKPHFDISQKSIVLWDDFDQLVFGLSRRIKATVDN